MKRLLFGILAVTLTVVLLAAAVLFVPPAFRLALRTANRFLPVTVDITEYHHVPGRLSVSGVRLSSPGGTFCEVARITIAYRPLQVFLGRIDVPLLEIERPRVTLRRSEDGTFDLFQPSAVPEQAYEKKQSGKEGGPWTGMLRPLRVREIRIIGGSVHFEDAADGLSLVWDSLDMEGGFSGRPLQANLNLSGGLLEASRGNHPPVEMSTEGRATLSDGTVSLREFQLKTETSSVSMSGRYSLAEEKLALDAELAGLPLDRILAAFGISGVRVEEVSGKIEAEAAGFKTGSLRADLEGSAFGQQVQARLAGRLREAGVVAVESLAINTPEAELTGEGSWKIESGGIAGKLVLVSSALEESFRPYGIRDLKVRGLHVDGTLHGTLEAPEVRLQLRFDALSWPEPLVTGFSAEGTVEPGRGIRLAGKAQSVPMLGKAGTGALISASLNQEIAACDIKAQPSLDLHGRLNLADRHAELTVDARAFSVSVPVEEPMQATATFSLTGRGSFRGNLDDSQTWKGEAEVETLLASLPDLSVRTARPVRVRVGQGRIEGEAALEANGSDLSLQGSYPLDGQGNVRLEVDGSLALRDFRLPLRSFLPVLEDVQGNLRIQGTVQGPVKAPRLQATAMLSDGSVDLTAPAEREEKKPSKGEEGQPEDSEQEEQPKKILTSAVGLSLDLNGSLAAPTGSLDAYLKEATLYGESLDEVRLQAESRDGKEWNPQLQVRRGSDTLTLQGSWEVSTGEISGTVRSTEIDLATLLKSLEIPVEGRTELEGTIQGTVGAPRFRLRATVTSLSIQDTPVGNLDADLAYEHDRVAFRGKADSDWFETTIHLTEDREFSFRGALEDFPVGPILARAGLRGWTGRASLSGHLAGPLGDFERWKGEIALEKVALEAAGGQVRLGGPTLLTFEEGRLSIPETSLVVADSSLQLKGTVGRENHLALRGTLPLVPFASLIPWIRFETARAETDLMIKGSLSSPEVDGTLHLEAEEVKLGALAYPVDSLQAEIRADSNRFNLVSLQASVADGEVRATGSMTVAPLSFENVHLILESVPVHLSDALAARVRGDLGFQGTRSDSRLKGRLRIIEARYEEDFNLAGMVLSPSRPPQKRVHAPNPFLRNMQLDLNIKSGPDLVVRNNVAQLILSTDMDIRGTAAHPVPLGIVKVEEGRVFFSKKEFDITQGSLSFIDPQGGPPKLQLESMVNVQGTTRQYTIYLTFTGPLDRIQLSLRSVPDLEREDIIFMLVTGKTRDEFYASSPGSGNPEETAQRLALSGIGFLIGSDVRHLTGLDTFEMERTEGEKFGIKTTVGKRFNERVEVRGVFALGSGQQVSEAQVGYLLTDMFYVVGTQRTDGSFGLDFRVRLGSR